MQEVQPSTSREYIRYLPWAIVSVFAMTPSFTFHFPKLEKSTLCNKDGRTTYNAYAWHSNKKNVK